jgi:hypothetical protein
MRRIKNASATALIACNQSLLMLPRWSRRDQSDIQFNDGGGF